MYCDYCGNRGATVEVAINEEESIHLCWFCEKRKDDIVKMFQGEKKIGCHDCKYFRQEDIHQTGFGTRHFYSCHKMRATLSNPAKECDQAEIGKGERWIQYL